MYADCVCGFVFGQLRGRESQCFCTVTCESDSDTLEVKPPLTSAIFPKHGQGPVASAARIRSLVIFEVTTNPN